MKFDPEKFYDKETLAHIREQDRLQSREFLESEEGKRQIRERLREDADIVKFDFERHYIVNTHNGYELPMWEDDDFWLTLDRVAIYPDDD